MKADELTQLAVEALEDLKAVDVRVIDVRGKSNVTDVMVVATGTSARHVKSLADNVIEKVKKSGGKPLGIEGEEVGEWVLVDLADVVVHVLQAEMRDFYQLEKLWETEPANRSKSSNA
jgi:ribosome-associated protein